MLTVITESSILDVSRYPELISSMIVRNKKFFTELKQLPKIFKKLSIIWSRLSATNSKDEAICSNRLRLKVVNFSIVTSSSILDVSNKYGISRKSLQSITLTEAFVLQFLISRYEMYCEMGVLIHMLYQKIVSAL